MAAWIELPTSTGACVLLDVEDYERLGGRCLSLGSHGYAQLQHGGQRTLLHRWIMQVPVGTRFRVIVDHINRNRLDCRRANLRIVTPSESNLNRGLPSRDLPRGVYRTRNKRYVARLKRARKWRNLGTYDTPGAAEQAVRRAREEVDRPEFLNPPTAA